MYISAPADATWRRAAQLIAARMSPKRTEKFSAKFGDGSTCSRRWPRKDCSCYLLLRPARLPWSFLFKQMTPNFTPDRYRPGMFVWPQDWNCPLGSSGFTSWYRIEDNSSPSRVCQLVRNNSAGSYELIVHPWLTVERALCKPRANNCTFCEDGRTMPVLYVQDGILMPFSLSSNSYILLVLTSTTFPEL